MVKGAQRGLCVGVYGCTRYMCETVGQINSKLPYEDRGTIRVSMSQEERVSEETNQFHLLPLVL